MSQRLKEFDTIVSGLTDRRGGDYGHPSGNFSRIQRFKAIIAECEHSLAREAMESIAIKLSRLIETPDHLDSWADIAGYARTGVMVTGPREPRE
jgi:hypothetical protein